MAHVAATRYPRMKRRGNDGRRKDPGKLFLARRSLAQDASLLTLPELPMASRMMLTLEKYRALTQLATGQPATIRIGQGTARVKNVFDLGTLHSSIVDVGILASQRHISATRPVIVDVGANIGQFCLASKLFWPQAQLTCFEPDPDVFAALVANTREHEGVTAVNIGLGRETGSLPWYPHELSVMSSFCAPSNTWGGSVPSGAQRFLPVARLDDVTAAIDAVDLLKVDVEGFEVEVLAGAPELLKRTHMLVVETSFRQLHGPSNLEVFELVRDSSPDARIVSIGRTLGPRLTPLCADVVIDLRGRNSAFEDIEPVLPGGAIRARSHGP
jgi:FkbM family methyltransferase